MSIAIDIPSCVSDISSNTMLKSLYIPRIFLNIDEKKIAEVFELLELGEVERVDLVPRPQTSGAISSNMAFVYFKRWNNTTVAQNLALRIMDPHREARIVYDDPWYWILLPNRNPHLTKPVEGDRIEFLKNIIKNLTTRVEILENKIVFNNGENAPPKRPPVLIRQNAVSSIQDDVESNITHPFEEETTIIPSPPRLHREITRDYISPLQLHRQLVGSFPNVAPPPIDQYINDFYNCSVIPSGSRLMDADADDADDDDSDSEKEVDVSEILKRVTPRKTSGKRDIESGLNETIKIGKNGARFVRVSRNWYNDNESDWCDP